MSRAVIKIKNLGGWDFILCSRLEWVFDLREYRFY